VSTRRGREGTLVNVKQGGTLTEYEDEDPAIGRHYQQALEAAGVENRMPGVV